MLAREFMHRILALDFDICERSCSVSTIVLVLVLVLVLVHLTVEGTGLLSIAFPPLGFNFSNGSCLAVLLSVLLFQPTPHDVAGTS